MRQDFDPELTCTREFLPPSPTATASTTAATRAALESRARMLERELFPISAELAGVRQQLAHLPAAA